MTAESSRALSGALIIVLLVASFGAAGAALPWWQEVMLENAGTVSDVACGAPLLSWLPAACLPDLYVPPDGGSDADVVHSDIYTKALTTADTREQVLLETRSHLNQSYGISLAKGKLELIEGLNNNSTSSAEALSNGLDRVDQFYATQQLRMISYLNRELLKWNQTIQTVQAHSGLGLQDITTTELCGYPDSSDVEPQFLENNVTLANGTTVTQYGFIWDPYDGNDGGNCRHHVIVPRDISEDSMTFTNGATGESYTYQARPLNITDPTGNDTIAHLVGGPSYIETWDQINQSYQRARDNLIGVHDDLFQQYQAGELTAPEALGPLESLITASTNYEDTGYYSYRALSLAQTGAATNASYAFTVNWSQAGTTTTHTDTGQLFIAEDTATLETGVEYDASNMTAWLVHNEDGGAVETRLNGTFTITDMVDTETGEPVNTTSVQSTRFYTASTADLQEQLDQQDKLIEQLISQQQTGLLDGIQGWLPDWLPSWASTKTAIAVGGIAGLYILVKVAV